MTVIGELYGMTPDQMRKVLERQQVRDYAKEMQKAAEAAADILSSTFTTQKQTQWEILLSMN